MQEQDIIQLIRDDARMMVILRIVASLGLPDWCVCAGFVRSKVWDFLHGLTGTHLPDVDVVYLDPDCTDESIEKQYERSLRQLDSSVPWSVKNQARMHTINDHAPYTSTADGLANFPEVCTAIGVYMDSNGDLVLVAPYGVDDLVNLIVRPTPFFESGARRAIYEERVSKKKWETVWHRLHIVHS
ncbi:nucleotidyltransferase family protein [Alicyclobacillus acidiphilus]|uniref:nucleotidyltransferase family protein n=1 Tax=Alicyclobacillus acidiphilus TaxID=182455 RepID=UPI000AA8E4DE|nr:nucleotidyltransferase family protein [Alicyclobacillus acidiphilus]